FSVGLSDKEGELAFTSGEDTRNHVLTGNGESSDVLKIKFFPLDKILAGQLPSVLKIDVEGFETPVLKGAHETLSNRSLHSVIIELNGNGSRYGFNDDAILNIMKDYGFSTYYYEPFSREIKLLNGKNNVSANTLFIRSEEVVKEKIAKAQQITIGKVKL
ncbi:MAG TPA: FkbM family methyltransferase, partial [Candidatus Deferrimicrobium sp.]|nr:FkbM family methyltransferase [Candidatus Deferrimicrobium sp.]